MQPMRLLVSSTLQPTDLTQAHAGTFAHGCAVVQSYNIAIGLVL